MKSYGQIAYEEYYGSLGLTPENFPWTASGINRDSWERAALCVIDEYERRVQDVLKQARCTLPPRAGRTDEVYR